MSTATPTLLTPDEAAPLLRRHAATLRRNLSTGAIPGVRIGGRWFLSSAVVDRILAGQDVAPSADPAESPAPATSAEYVAELRRRQEAANK